MFTGLIQDVGTIRSVTRRADGSCELAIATRLGADGFARGESIAVSGACLTVVGSTGGEFRTELSAETLRRTTLVHAQVGQRVNLERALRVGDRMGGHWVQGHVDGLARVRARRPEGGFEVLELELPPSLAPFFIEKGSVAVDGVSLTVNDLSADSFRLTLIPETLAATTLGDLKGGEAVNLEADLIGKYVARRLALRGGQAAGESRLTLEALERAGFGLPR